MKIWQWPLQFYRFEHVYIVVGIILLFVKLAIRESAPQVKFALERRYCSACHCIRCGEVTLIW